MMSSFGARYTFSRRSSRPSRYACPESIERQAIGCQFIAPKGTVEASLEKNRL
jgi:hypothetical protein